MTLWRSLSMLSLLTSAYSALAAKEPRCQFPDGDGTSVDALADSIVENKAACGLPWRALKFAVKDASGRAKLDAAYDLVAKRHPDLIDHVEAMKAVVAAASGQPRRLLSIADANALAHKNDGSFSNYSCFIRSRYGFDVSQGPAFCDAAVAAGRPPWSLLNRGVLRLQLGLDREALSDFEEALATRSFGDHSMYFDAVFGRGVARLRLGDVGGQIDIDAALATRPSVAADFQDVGISP